MTTLLLLLRCSASPSLLCGGLQVARAPASALGQWSVLGYDALPTVHSWSTRYGGFVWAPEVTLINGIYVMYVTLRYVATGLQAIGIATSGTAAGPYTPYDTGYPLVAQYGVLGSIDPFPFLDSDGSRYLYYRGPGPDGVTPNIYVQAMASDGLSVYGVVSDLIAPTDAWEMYDNYPGVTEAPAVQKCYSDTAYCLFYSGSPTQTEHYATGFAMASNPFGPFVKYSGNPILSTNGGILGPGSVSFLTLADGRIFLMYQSWDSLAYQARELSMALLTLPAAFSYVPVAVTNPTWESAICQ